MPAISSPRAPAISRMGAALIAVCFAVPALVLAQKPYHVIDQWKTGGEGFWDYLIADAPAHRVYITRGTHVDIIDTQTGKLIGSINGLTAIHGVALDNAGKFGYVSDGGANQVVVFDRSTLASVATIPVGRGPDAIVFEPATQTIWAFDGHSKDVSVISAAERKVVATIPLPGEPEFTAVDGKGLVYDVIEDKNEAVRLDAHTNKLTAEWPTTGCESPSGLAIDIAGSRLFAACTGNKMAVIDTNTGKVLANPAICSGPDAAAWNAAQKLAFASCGDGTLSVINAAVPSYPTIESLPTRRGARTMAYDSVADRIYLVTADMGPRPAATPGNPHPRPTMIPNTFTVIVVAR